VTSKDGFEPWPDSAYSASLRNRFPYDEHTSPFAIVRDVNDDGREDVALDGWREQGRFVLLLVSEGNRYRVAGGLGVEWGPHPSRPRFPGSGLRVDGGPPWTFRWAPGSQFDHGFLWSEKAGFRFWIDD